MWKKIKSVAVSAIILALGGTCLYLYYGGGRGAAVRRLADPPAIVREIQDLSELVTVKYSIQKVIGLEENKVPFGSERILLLVQGQVLGGVDLAGLNVNDVEVSADGAVAVRLPPPKVMHVYLDEKQTRVWDRSKTWWAVWEPFDPELEQKARLAALEDIQVAAAQMGILRNAQTNAETAIRKLLRAGGVESVRFTAPPGDKT
ncbi:MAG TPA: DUF4230 domain-containing protein [Verrucomicrobiae bacterium]|nr:DUF4230 domain-containing protein [Verrucomicrobiae bacterium]